MSTALSLSTDIVGLSWNGRLWPEPDDTELTIRRWARDNPDLRGCRTVPEVLRAIAGNADGLLLFLIAWSQVGCRVADHLIARTMAPKLRQMAGRDHIAEFDDYLAQLWLQVQGYPLQRRRRRVAANLALDTLKAVLAERDCGREAPMVPDLLEIRLGPVPETPLSRRLIDAGQALGLFDEHTARVLVSVYVLGLSGDQAAVAHGITADMVRYRCSKYVRRMSQHRRELLQHLTRPEIREALHAA
ncbi:hypothetical protein [Enemella sp. A6]|uniref:hypothetical protein n=1 Tax=Enemella sp. A6 TaxID=3440152 RepID=UPI003EB7B674